MSSKKFLLSSLIAVALGAGNCQVAWGTETPAVEYKQGEANTGKAGLIKILNIESKGSGYDTNSFAKLLYNSKDYIQGEEEQVTTEAKSFHDARKQGARLNKLARTLDTFAHIAIDEGKFDRRETLFQDGDNANMMRALWSSLKAVLTEYASLKDTLKEEGDKDTLVTLCGMILGDADLEPEKKASTSSVEELRAYLFGSRMQQAIYNVSMWLDIDGLYDAAHYSYDDTAHKLKNQQGDKETTILGNYRIESINGPIGSIITKTMRLSEGQLKEGQDTYKLGDAEISGELYDLLKSLQSDQTLQDSRYSDETLERGSKARGSLKDAVLRVESLIKKRQAVLEGEDNGTVLSTLSGQKQYKESVIDLMGLARLTVAGENVTKVGGVNKSMFSSGKKAKTLTLGDVKSLLTLQEHSDLVDVSKVPLNKVTSKTTEMQQALQKEIEGLGLGLSLTAQEKQTLIDKSYLETEKSYTPGSEYSYDNEKIELESQIVAKLKRNVTRTLNEIAADEKIEGHNDFVISVLKAAYGVNVDSESDAVNTLQDNVSIEVNNSSKSLADDVKAAAIVALKAYLENTGVSSSLFKLEGTLLTEISRLVDGSTDEAISELLQKSTRQIKGNISEGLATLFVNSLSKEEKDELQYEEVKIAETEKTLPEKLVPSPMWNAGVKNNIVVGKKRAATDEEYATAFYEALVSSHVDLSTVKGVSRTDFSEALQGEIDEDEENVIGAVNEAYNIAIQSKNASDTAANKNFTELSKLKTEITTLKEENVKLQSSVLEKNKEIESLKRALDKAEKSGESPTPTVQPKKEISKEIKQQFREYNNATTNAHTAKAIKSINKSFLETENNGQKVEDVETFAAIKGGTPAFSIESPDDPH